MPYRIVLFKNDNTVECVPTFWIYTGQEGEMCFWPGGKDPKKRIKKHEIPDKDAWKSFAIRTLGLSEYKDFETASRQVRKVIDQETSNPDEYSDGVSTRQVNLPMRYREPEVHVHAVGSDEEELNDYGSRASASSTSMNGAIRLPQLQPDKDMDDEAAPIEIAPIEVAPIEVAPIEVAPMEVAPMEVPTIQQVMKKLTDIEKKVDTLITGLTKPATTEDETLEDMLPRGEKLNSIGDLEAFEKDLETQELQKQLVRVLSSLTSSEDLPKCCRCVMRAVLTNGLMSLFSSRGQKGKLSFTERLLCKLLIATLKKISKGFKTSQIVFEMGEVLRNAPNQPGGINYQKRHGQKTARKSLPDSDLDVDIDLE